MTCADSPASLDPFEDAIAAGCDVIAFGPDPLLVRRGNTDVSCSTGALNDEVDRGRSVEGLSKPSCCLAY